MAIDFSKHLARANPRVGVVNNQAHYEGRVAYEGERGPLDNPYDDATPEQRDDWLAGWHAAQDEEAGRTATTAEEAGDPEDDRPCP